jgi:hypothetical protein
MMKHLQLIALTTIMVTASSAYALDVLNYLTDKEGKYTGPTVEENVAKMDTDNSGFADVMEVRAFLALKHGADSQKAVLNRWEISATSQSCGTTSFVEELSE